jgi:hypothetical protein
MAPLAAILFSMGFPCLPESFPSLRLIYEIFRRIKQGESQNHSCAGGFPNAPLMESRDLMQDVTMLLFTVVFFGLAFLYVKACQKLR